MKTSLMVNNLKPLLKSAIEEAFVDAIRVLNKINEEIYVFVLYTTNSYSNTLPIYNTEEALERTARKYIDERGYDGVSVDEMSSRLRWSCGDWKYRDYSSESLTELNSSLRAVSLKARAFEDSLEFDKAEQIYQAVRNVIHESLHNLNSDGVFGVGEVREKLAVFIWLSGGDTDELRESIKMCNPSEVFERYKKEMKVAHHLANF